MIKSTESILGAKKLVEKLRDIPLKIKVNLGRNKIVEFEGKISGVYPAIFTITPTTKTYLGITSYSYSEYVYGSIVIKPLKATS